MKIQELTLFIRSSLVYKNLWIRNCLILIKIYLLVGPNCLNSPGIISMLVFIKFLSFQ
jgi:hypothetical protein